jgi:integrase
VLSSADHGLFAAGQLPPISLVSWGRNGRSVTADISDQFGPIRVVSWGRNTQLPEIHLHDLRHTHATLALEAGVHPKVVSDRLGHATVAITLDIYSHAIPALSEEAAATVALLVMGPS